MAVDFLSRVFGPATSDPVFLCSLPNAEAKDREPGERRLMSRDMADVEAFVTRWDRKDRGLFFCVSTLRQGAQAEKQGGSPRCEANASELAILHADIDSKDIDIGLDEAVVIVRSLPCPPSIIVRSGNGLHLYWLLSENALEGVEAEAVKAILRQVADLVAGDLAVAEIVRLMRVPGSHNTKRGAWEPVTIVEADYDRVWHLQQIEDMVAICGPMIRRKATIAHTGIPVADNPFLAVAARFGFKPPIDVERRLAAMSFQGTSGSSIHETQLQVSASLLTRGTPADEVVAIVLDATRAAAGEYGERWNWRREERAVRDMCDGWLRKNPTVRPLRQERRADPDTASEADQEPANGTTGATVHQIATRRKSAGKPRGSNALPVAIAEGVIEAVRADGGDVLLSDGDLWLYRDGLWSAATPSEEQWLRTLIQGGCDALGAAGDSKAANGAWKRLLEHPELFHRTVAWDSGDLIATTNGMLDLTSRDFGPHSPDRYARRKIGTAYEPGRGCPKWLRFLNGCFINRQAVERQAFLDVLQDAFGAMLAVKALSREQRKALFLLGPSRTGKTQVAIVARRLMGDPVAAPSIMDLTKEFGLQALYGARAWIRDDAVNEGDVLDPGRFKTIVTGEPVDVNRKGKSYVTVSFEIPVLLTANSLPRARDATDAIYNRCIVLDMTNIVSEERAEELARAFGVTHSTALADAIFDEEGPGILNWALDGLDRLREQGRYRLPDIIKASIQHFKDGNNPIGEWARAALRAAPHSKVSKADLLCAYHGWQKEEQGDDAKAGGSKYLMRNLRTMMPSLDDGVKSHGLRFVGGLALTDEGLALWQHHQGDPLRSGSKGSSLSRHDVNKAWKMHGEEDGGGGETHF